MGAGADEVRAYRQPQDRQGARSRRAALTAWTRRQGDRIEMPFAAAHESVHGTFETFRDVRHLVAIGGKADVAKSEKRPVDVIDFESCCKSVLFTNERKFNVHERTVQVHTTMCLSVTRQERPFSFLSLSHRPHHGRMA